MTTHTRLTRLTAAFFLILGTVPALAVTRTVSIDAPAQAAAESKVTVTVTASTDAGAGEQVGFLYVEYSVDGGRTWTGTCYDQSLGPKAKRTAIVPLGAAGSQAKVRTMVAFRGGKAGDVDFAGAPVSWSGSWTKWESPPARYATIDVVAP